LKTEFQKAIQPRELRSLVAFDQRVFPASDRFDAEYWRQCDAFWMLVDGRKAGCCAFEKDTNLYIATTGILPKFQRKGLGALMKAWQIAYARHHGFERLVTHMRKSNQAIIALNRRFGFRVIRTVEGYYEDPDEPAVVMRLDLIP
jgi:ribosomal protein S18 acetylase RimI-like enzyme